MRLSEGNIFTLEIGGLTLSLLHGRPWTQKGRDSRERIDPEHVAFHLHCGHIPKVKKKKKVFDSGSGWSLFSNGGGFYLQNGTLATDSEPDTLVALDRNFRGGDIYLEDPVPDDRVLADLFGYPLNQILMILLLSRRNGIVVHACGVEDGGRGYLFAGNSANGKSTLARLWHDRGATVLNDDRIIVRERDGVFRMYGTPWHGTFDVTSGKALPVDKIFFLRHGRENRLAPKAGSEAVSMLLTRSFPTFWDPAGMEKALGIMDHMSSALPSYELHFRPDGDVIDFIRRLNR
jgi:hypothetical protein